MQARQGKDEPAFLTARATAAILAVSTKTLYCYLRRGILTGARIPAARAWYERAPKGGRAYWRVSLASVEALLIRSYDGGKVPKGLLIRLRRLAKPGVDPQVGERGTPK